MRYSCFPFVVKLDDSVDDCNIGKSAPLTLSDKLGISAFVCSKEVDI